MITEDGLIEEDERRFRVSLMIRHPAIDPELISSVLGLDGHYVFAVGQPRKTPSGQSLPGVYRETSWRHCARFKVQGQHFQKEFCGFVSPLKQHNRFFKKLKSTGGSLCLILQFLGDGYHGDEIPARVLAEIAGLGIDLGIECFDVPQR